MKLKLYYSIALKKEPKIIEDVKDYYINNDKDELVVELNNGEKLICPAYTIRRTEEIE